MCLAMPGQIVEIIADDPDIAKVDFSGVRRNVNIALVGRDEAIIGNWVLVHVGFALRVLNEQEAAETLRYLKMIGDEYREELNQIRDVNDAQAETHALQSQAEVDP